MNLRQISSKIIPEKVKHLLKNIWPGIKKYRIALLQLVGMLFVFLIILNGIFYFVSVNSGICNICHYMKPHYQQWQKSVHKDISCVKCHPNRRLLTGAYLFRYISGTYNPRARAEVSNDICLNCHQEKSLHTKTAFKMNISFDHGDHLGDLKRGKKLHCTSCHAKGMGNEHFYVDQNVCYVCHFKGANRGHAVTGCNVCHGIPKKIVSHEGFQFDHSAYTKIGVDCSQCHIDVITGNGDVDSTRCYSCHVEKLEDFSNSQKVHQIHISKNGIDCDNCHNQIQHGKIKMISSLEGGCENCHQKMHVYQREMYIGIGAKDVMDTPSRMFAAQVSCQGCHIDLNHDNKSDLSEKRESCVKCHNKNYGTMADRWIKTMHESVKSVEPIIGSVNSKLTSLGKNSKMNENEKNLLSNISNNYNLLLKGKAVHNIDYAYKILNYIVNSYDTLNIKYWKTGQRSQKPRFISDEKEYCNLCHSVLPAKEIKKFKDRTFPHERHKNSVKCSQCHSFETHKKLNIDSTGCDNCHKILLGSQKIQKFGDIVFPHSKHSKELKIECQKCHVSSDFKKGGIKKTACKECHHQGKTLIMECKKCHSLQENIYTGNLIKGINQPDVMKAGGVECDACHVSDEKTVVRPKKEVCSKCHEKSYESMMGDWQKEIREMLLQINSLVSKKKDQKLDASSKNIISSAIDLYNKIRTDGSSGVHNYMLISSELGKLKDSLEKTK